MENQIIALLVYCLVYLKYGTQFLSLNCQSSLIIFFSHHMSRFKKAHGWQDVLLNFTNNAKLSLDGRKITLALFTDLSKAFDCLPYKPLISTLHAYNVDRNACLIILSYFTNRKQRVKLGDSMSDLRHSSKCAPKVHYLGLLCTMFFRIICYFFLII